MLSAGIYTMPAAEYHADPAPEASLSNSVAQILIGRSPHHAWLAHPRMNPNYATEDDKKFDLGTAAHALLLENEESKIIVLDFDDYRKKDAQEQRDAAYEAGKTPVLASQWDDLECMVQAARKFVASSELAGIFEDGQPEQTAIWQDDSTWCRARIDWLPQEMPAFLDYKSTTDASPEAFIRQISRMGYDFQAVFYARGIEAVTGRLLRPVFLAQEVKPPYACSFISLSNAYVELANAKVEHALAMWRECLNTGEWPAYPTRICYAEPPAWALNQWMEQGNEE